MGFEFIFMMFDLSVFLFNVSSKSVFVVLMV